MAYINKPKKQPKPIDNNKKERSKFYSSVKWLKLRDAKLNNQPLCECCLNGVNEKITPATQVHHINGFMHGKNDPEKWAYFLDVNNLLSICDECHGLIHSKRK